MIRLSKLTDYAFVILTTVASHTGDTIVTAKYLAEVTGIPSPTVSKILKTLSREGLLVANRGMKGGYRLSRPASEVTAAHVVELLDGPVAITDCIMLNTAHCAIESCCKPRRHWIKINQVFLDALNRVTLQDMISPLPAEDRAIHESRQEPKRSKSRRPAAVAPMAATSTGKSRR